MTDATSTAAGPRLGRDIHDLLAGIGRHWGWLLTLGILSALLGICLVVWPSATIVVIATFVGAYLLVSGIFWIVAAFSSSLAPAGYRWLLGISGVFSVLLGLMAFRSIAQSVAILVLLIGFGWMFQGLAQLIEGVADRGMPGRGWMIFTGILSVLAGLVVLLYPSPSLYALSLVGGIWLIVLGLVEVVGAFRLRRLST